MNIGGAPLSEDSDFAPPAPAKAWGWGGLLPAESSLFEDAAAPWPYDFSVAADLYTWTAGTIIPTMQSMGSMMGVGR